MKRAIKSALRNVLAKRDLALVRKSYALPANGFIQSAVESLQIDLVLDVGANTGQTGLDLRRWGYKERIVSFEPQTDAFEVLQSRCTADKNWSCRQVALGAMNGTLDMNIAKFSPSSSILTVGTKHIDVWPDSATCRTERVEVRCLDDLVHELDVPEHKTLLKLDTQGYESQVLAGASSCLRWLRAAYVELLFAPLYEGQSRYFQVMETLEYAGLRFAGLFGTYCDPKTGFALYGDGFFVRQEN